MALTLLRKVQTFITVSVAKSINQQKNAIFAGIACECHRAEAKLRSCGINE